MNSNDDNPTEDKEILNKNPYSDDDEFLGAGGLLKDHSSPDPSTSPSKNAASSTQTTPPTHIEMEAKSISPSKDGSPTKEKKLIKGSNGYGLSDDTSSTSDDDRPNAQSNNTNNSNNNQHNRGDTVNTVDLNRDRRRSSTAAPPSSTPLDAAQQYEILLNDKSFMTAEGADFPSNYIKTAKYTVLSFIPLNMFEQFRRVANIYFLLIILLQLIPEVSPFPIYTSIMPLAVILIAGAIKDGIEDHDRHKSDRVSNSIPVLRLDPKTGHFIDSVSADLAPSDIIKIERNNTVPADCIVFGSECVPGDRSSGVCYVNTSQMDGENAPKLRRAVPSTVMLDEEYLSKMRGTVRCPPNTKSLHGFTGALSIERASIPIGHNWHRNPSAVGSTNGNSNVLPSVHDRNMSKNGIREKGDILKSKDVVNDDDDDDAYLSATVAASSDDIHNKEGNTTAPLTGRVDSVSASNSPFDHRRNSTINGSRRVSLSGEYKVNGLSDLNFVFRGSKLVNTECIYALVLFVGSDTKLMLNRSETPFKFSKFEKKLNEMIGSVMVFNFVLCVLLAILANAVYDPVSDRFSADKYDFDRGSLLITFAQDFCSWLILTSWMIPFPLYVTWEMVKVIQAQWVAWDDAMAFNPDDFGGNPLNGMNSLHSGKATVYGLGANDDEEPMTRPTSASLESQQETTRNQRGKGGDAQNVRNGNGNGNGSNPKGKGPELKRTKSAGEMLWDEEYGGTLRRAKTKNSNLNEELGHIDYIFTDKTGTLTQNLMKLSKCSIGGIKYQNDNSLRSTSSYNYTMSMSPDFAMISVLIQRMIHYQQRKTASMRRHQRGSDQGRSSGNIQLIERVNQDLERQYLSQKESKSNITNISRSNSKKSDLSSRASVSRSGNLNQIQSLRQLELESHFLFNLLLCSDTLPSSKSEKKDSALSMSVLNPKVNSNSSRNVDYAEEIATHGANDSEHEDEMDNDDPKVGDIEFMSPSPDEVAFAEALYDHGVVFEERGADGTILVALRVSEHKVVRIRFRILATLSFSARRKRMAVIVEDEMGEIHLYSKGADSVMFKNCDENSKTLIHETRRHVTSFACGGSRTLVLGWRTLSAVEYEEFDGYYRSAEVALSRREQLIEDAFVEIEHSLILLGCTAVEDPMQEGVPDAIVKLKAAAIKVIMVTGDKEETAISIGRQSMIIPPRIPESELLKMSARAPVMATHSVLAERSRRASSLDRDSKHTVGATTSGDEEANYRNAQEKARRRVGKKLAGFLKAVEDKTERRDEEVALVLNGDALEMCLHRDLQPQFRKLFAVCSAMVCNRCNPAQKAMLVAMAKIAMDGVTLAIGDGANDVTMIQSANVGVGIMGKEGTQASLAADFVIHRFHHLTRLLFVHGRYSLLRTASVSFITLYKNMGLSMTLVYFGFYSKFTSAPCFNNWLLSGFNILFVAIFPICVGAFEQDISQRAALQHPAAYLFFKRFDAFFNLKTFAFWMWTAVWQSMLWFFLSVAVYQDSMDIYDSTGEGGTAKNGGLEVWGTQLFTANVIIICLKMQAETDHWNWTYFASTAAGIVLYFITLSILSNWIWMFPDSWNMMELTFGSSVNWLLLFVQCTLCILPGVLYNLWRREKKATLSNVLSEAEQFGYLEQNGQPRATKDIVTDYLERKRSRRWSRNE